MMGDRRVISVIGATGEQGSSVTRSLLQNRDFAVRCLARDPRSKKAQDLLSLGAEIVRADGGNSEELKEALNGSWGLFVNLPSELFPEEVAVQMGRNIFHSAGVAGVKHVVFSSAPYASRLTNGKVNFDSFDVKAKIEEVGQAEQAFTTFTPIMVGFYLEHIGQFNGDLYGGFPVKENSEGVTVCRLPYWGGREEMPWISIADDFGDIVHGIFLNPLRWNRRLVQCHAELLSAADMTATYSTVTNKKSVYIPYENIGDMQPGMFEGVQNMFLYTQMREGEYYPNGISETRTAAELKEAAYKAKKYQGRETLLSVREFFDRYKAAPTFGHPRRG